MAFDTWVNIVFPSEKKTPYGLIATDPDPGMSNSTRYYIEGGILRSHALAAQRAFDQALELAMSGEAVKVVTEAEWRRISAQATEPARKAAVRQASQRRREIAAALKEERRAEEREAKEKAERNGNVPADVTDQDLRDAAVEESIALAFADTHEQPGTGEDDGNE